VLISARFDHRELQYEETAMQWTGFDVDSSVFSVFWILFNF